MYIKDGINAVLNQLDAIEPQKPLMEERLTAIYGLLEQARDHVQIEEDNISGSLL